MQRNSSAFGLNRFAWGVEMSDFSVQRYFPTLLNNLLYLWYRLRIVSEWLLNLPKSGSVTLLTGSKGCRWAISIPIRGKWSFPKIFLSCPEVIKNGVSSAIQPLDCILTTILPMMFIVSLVNPRYNSLVFLSTGCIFNCGVLNSIRARRFALGSSLCSQNSLECSD